MKGDKKNVCVISIELVI